MKPDDDGRQLDQEPAPPRSIPESLFAAYQKWAASGSQEAFEEFVMLARTTIRGAILRTLSARAPFQLDLAEDLIQETYLKLCEGEKVKLLNLIRPSPLGIIAFLRVVAHNVASDYFRARTADKRGGSQAPLSLDDSVPTKPVHAHEAVENFLLMDRIRRCLQDRHHHLRDQNVFWLYFRQGLTTKAIAAVPSVGMSQKGVESLILRITRAIRDCLKGKRLLSASAQLE